MQRALRTHYQRYSALARANRTCFRPCFQKHANTNQTAVTNSIAATPCAAPRHIIKLLRTLFFYSRNSSLSTLHGHFFRHVSADKSFAVSRVLAARSWLLRNGCLASVSASGRRLQAGERWASRAPVRAVHKLVLWAGGLSTAGERPHPVARHTATNFGGSISMSASGSIPVSAKAIGQTSQPHKV